MENDSGFESGNNAQVADVQTTETDSQDTGLYNDIDNDVDSVQQEESVKSSEAADPKPVEKTDENAKYAAARREAEEKAKRIEQKLQQNSYISKAYGRDYEVYSEEDIQTRYGMTFDQFEHAIKRQQYEQQGINPDLINEIINEHPDIKQAREEKRNAYLVKEYNSLLAELKDEGLSDLVKSPEDIPETVFTKWNEGKNGLSLAETFFLENRKKISSEKVAAAKQAALNSVNSKSHLKANGSGVEIDSINIPGETMKLYKSWFPKMSESDIKKHYAESLK